MNDRLTIDYEEFPEVGIKIMTISRGDEAIHMLHGDNAEITYNLLLGTLEDAIKTMREEKERRSEG